MIHPSGGLFSTFYRFDKDHTGYIPSDKIPNFLIKADIPFSTGELTNALNKVHSKCNVELLLCLFMLHVCLIDLGLFNFAEVLEIVALLINKFNQSMIKQFGNEYTTLIEGRHYLTKSEIQDFLEVDEEIDELIDEVFKGCVSKRCLDLYSTFDLLDKPHTGYIPAHKITKFLIEGDVPFSTEELRNVLNKVHSKYLGLFDFAEVLEIVALLTNKFNQIMIQQLGNDYIMLTQGRHYMRTSEIQHFLEDAFGTVRDEDIDELTTEIFEGCVSQRCSVLRKAFESFDSQKSGSISCDMVSEILRLMGQPFDKKILQELIEEVDADKSGRLEFEEFVTLAAKFIVEEDDEAMQKELKEAFRLYDKEGNGYIKTSALREILRELDDQLTEKDLDNLIEEIDTDGSGTVDFDEFMEMMTGE
ncbi:hypothetical protein FQA39_LY09427 [Lamprigera yunnana]|nr:hypothetical protein FQA39_LY09427 [Lamprigera yunnana]